MWVFTGCAGGSEEPMQPRDMERDDAAQQELDATVPDREDAQSARDDAGPTPDVDGGAATRDAAITEMDAEAHDAAHPDASVPDAASGDTGVAADAALPDAGTDSAVPDAGDPLDALHIVSSQPADASTGAPAGARIVVAWSADLDVSSIATVTLRDPVNAVVPGTFLVPGDDSGGFFDPSTGDYYPAPVPSNTFMFYPTARLAPGAAYSMDFGALTGSSGELVANGESLAFTVVNAAQIVAGGLHNVMLEGDGSVWAWGGSIYGAAGSGATNTSIWAPARVVGFGGVGTLLGPALQVAATDYSSLALLEDGTVCAWGHGDRGQLGDGQTYANGTGVPVHVANLTEVVAIAAGTTFSLALKKDGTVWAWGGGDSGQLGRGTTAGSSTPVQVLTSTGPLTGIVAIVAGANHALAITNLGSVVAWGSNSAGQLGIGSMVDSLFAVPVPGLSKVTALSARYNHSLALDATGSVYQWGSREQKQGGGITWTSISTPTDVPFGMGITITGVRAGFHHFLARTADGTLYSWGLDFNGELFGAAGVDRATPALAASFPDGLVDFAAGGAFLGSHSVYVLPDGQVSARGANGHGQSAGFQ